MDLGKARRVRGGHKGYVNKLISQVNDLCENYEESGTQRERLLGLKSSLTEKINTIKKLDEQILEEVKEEDIEKEIEDSGEFCEAVYRCLAKIETFLNTVPSSGATQKVKECKQKPKLPKLTLKEFTGDPANWQSFWDCFETAIYKNDELSEVDKFNYLKGCLSGSAASAIDGISLTNENFKVAIDILKDRFANPQLLISSYMESLLKLPAVNAIEQISKLKDLYDKIEVNVRSLDSLGIKSETYGTLLSPIIMNKIPSELRLIISRKFTKEQSWDIEELLKAIKVEIEARERCKTMRASENSETARVVAPFNREKSHFVKQSSQSTASALSVEKTQNIYCSFCKGQHSSVKCSVYSDSASRKTIARQKARCFVCLRFGHVARNCRSTRVCQFCAGKHHTALCDKENGKTIEARHKEQNREEANTISTQPGKSGNPTSSNVCHSHNAQILLQTAVAPVGRPDNPQMRVNARIILDSGSQRSYVTNELKKSLNLYSLGTDNLLIKTFGEETPRLKSCELVKMSIKGIDGMELYVNAYSVPSICSPLSNQAVQLAVSNYPSLGELELADIPANSENVEIDVLLGADYYWNFVTSTTKRIGSPGPIAIYTRLGWVLSGPVISDPHPNLESSIQLNSTHILKIVADPILLEKEKRDEVKEELKRFWDLESLGIHDDEISVYDKFTQGIQFNKQRYETELPFKEAHPLLPDNYATCVSRLKNLLTRLQGRPEILKEYNGIIQEQLKQGVIEPVPEEEQESSSIGDIHYLPHREVIRMDKETTKLRIVYDASARSTGPSLNDCLLSGPSLTPLIFDILLIAMTADIEKAFLNISIKPEHCDYLRFLWVDDPFAKGPQIQHLRFKRVVFGVTSSPFILNATLRHHMNQYADTESDLVNDVLRSLYVDDYASGSNDPTSAFNLSRKIKTTMSEGGFNMRKWMSNSRDLMEMWNESEELPEVNSTSALQNMVVEEDRGYIQHLLPKVSETSPRVLSQIWDTDRDEFNYDLSKPLSDLDLNSATKRMLLSVTAKFYEPLGLIAPVVLLFKLLFQKLCKNNADWDDQIDETLYTEWSTLIDDLREVKNISLGRCYCNYLFNTDVKSVELHVFGDASETSYGSCVYLRCEHESEIHCNLIASKTRVSPTTSNTIPRLELLACLISAKLGNSVQQALKGVLVINKVVYWTDSTVALSWIQGVTKEFKQFVQNRVVEIRRLTSVDSWRYCPTDQNPADIASRGAKASELTSDEKWWHGPIYLSKSEEYWPRPPKQDNSNKAVEQELKSKKTSSDTTALHAAVSKKPKLEELIKVSKYSSVLRLVRVTAYVLRFVNNLKCRLERREPLSSELSADEINSAERLWIKKDKVPRQRWKIGRVQRLLTSKDGKARAAAVRVYQKRGTIININRPLQKLFPIEMESSESSYKKSEVPLTFVEHALQENIN